MPISNMQQPRQMYEYGGLSAPRQNYGLGSFVKKAVRGVKKIAKSPIGKAALIGGGLYGLNRFGPMGIKGFAEDVNAVMQNARVCLAPIRFGAGLKGKLVDAMKNGTPCITTSIGAEGMFGDIEPNGFIEDNPELFTNKAISLFQNETIWKAKVENGFEIVNQHFNKIKQQQKLIGFVEDTIQQLNQHRLNNFTGQMLHHHMLKSTKFMSKWIEEKNSKAR